ncbi:MAG: response regulator [Endomicrobiales bacterium]|nr:response regulator [Endomicrobiales bacterium]
MALGKILIVDDDKDTVIMLRDLLESEGYEVITAYTGARALERVREERPDLVLLDIMMPGLDGFSVCREIKSRSATRNVKVVVITSRDSGNTLQESLEHQADSFVGKPYDGKALVSRIAKLLKKQPGGRR